MVPSGQARIAVLSLTDPFAIQTGGTLRTRALVRALRRAEAEVRIYAPSAGTGAELESRPVGRSVGERSIPSGLRRLKRELLPMPTIIGGRNEALRVKLKTDGPFHGVVVSALSQVPLAQSSGAPVWLDFMDLWSDFCHREKLKRRGLSRATAGLQEAHLRRVERKAAEEAAVVTAVGWADVALLRSMGINKADWLPVPLPDGEFRAQERVACGGPVAGFLGNFDYWPNVDAYDQLVVNWLPQLRASGWRCVVAGRGSESLTPHDGLEIMGTLDSVDDFYRSIDVTLAPIRLGGGMKVKILESFSRGKPVIATPFAVEGFPPGFRKLVRVQPLGVPLWNALQTVAPISPDAEELDMFRESTAQAGVRALLNRLLDV